MLEKWFKGEAFGGLRGHSPRFESPSLPEGAGAAPHGVGRRHEVTEGMVPVRRAVLKYHPKKSCITLGGEESCLKNCES